MAKISKILYIVTQSEFGGASRYVFDLASHLPKDRFEAAVAAGGDKSLFVKLAENNITIFKLRHMVRPISPVNDILAIFELLKLFKQFKPDVIHLNSSKASIVGSLASALYRIKKKHRLVYTVHGFVFNEPLPKAVKFFYYWAEKFSAIFKDRLICIFQADMDQAIKNKIAPPKKFALVYNGIPKISYLSPQQARNELGLPADKYLIGNIANFYPTKGLAHLVRSAQIVCQKFPDVVFVLIGDGLQRALIEAEIKKMELGNKFLLLGSRPGAAKYLKAFDIFALSSLKEGLPYSLLEAMQAGRPCVATAVGGNPEIIRQGGNGLLVQPADAPAMAEAIIKLKNDPALAEKIARQAESEISEKFSLENMIQNTISIY